MARPGGEDRKSTRLNSSHPSISYAVFCLKKKKKFGNDRHPVKQHRVRSSRDDEPIGMRLRYYFLVVRELPLNQASLHFFFNDPATTEIYTLSLHDALPICPVSTATRCHFSARSMACSALANQGDRKSTRLNSSHPSISYAVFCLKKKKKTKLTTLSYKKKKTNNHTK